MASIGEITQAASYRGDAALGGGLGVGVTIDSSPLQRLATFTYYRDRDLWQKKQRDDKMIADKIAMITAFDINSPLKPYADDLKSKSDRIKDYIKKRPSALNYDKDKEGFQEVYSMIGEFENAKKHATSNDSLYNKAKAEAEREPNAANRKAKLELLNIFVDDLFSNGVEDAYNKQFQASAEIKPDDYKIGKIPTTDIFTITPHPNRIDITGKTYGDMNRLDALIEGEYLNLTKQSIVDTPEYKQMSEPEKKRALLEEQIRSRAKIGLDNTAVTVNALVEQFRNKIGKDLTIDQIPESELSKGGSIGGYIRLAKKFNEQVREINSATGKTFSEIDIVDGASPTELIKLEWFGANGETLSKDLKPTIVETDDELERRRIALGWANVNKDAGVGMKDAIENPAIQFGEHINRVKTYFKNNKADAMIVRFSALDEDTKKALGLYKKNEEGKLEPIEMEGQNSFVTYFNDGTYRVGTTKGGYGGNPGTLETLRQGYINTVKAGLNKEGVQSEGFQKNAEDGFRKIFGVNNSEAIWDSWSGGQQQQSSNVPTYKTADLKKAGWTDDEIKQAVDAGKIKTN